MQGAEFEWDRILQGVIQRRYGTSEIRVMKGNDDDISNFQFFDGKHRIFSIKSFDETEFNQIFGEKGLRINLYSDIPSLHLINISQCYFKLIFRFE